MAKAYRGLRRGQAKTIVMKQGPNKGKRMKMRVSPKSGKPYPVGK